MMVRVGFLVGLLISTASAFGFELKAERVADNAYALVGPTDGRTYENYALNNTMGFVVTRDGVVLIDSGASNAGAAMIEKSVRTVTDKPIRYVINTGSQDHRWLGNEYFAKKGATIIALRATVETQRQFAEQHLAQLRTVLKDRIADTKPVYAPKPLEGDRHEWVIGDVRFELLRFGDAHFAGDAVVWLPEQKLLFSGDLVYVDRVLGILPWTDARAWKESFHAMESLAPTMIVPGHGKPCNLAKAKQETGDYLDWLVKEVGAAAQEWEPLEEVVERLSDAKPFAHLAHYDTLHRANINRTYLQFEGK